MSFLVVLIVLGIVFWFMAIQPQRRRQREHMAMQDAVAEGLEIITAGGLHGTVVEAGESVIRIEVAPGVIVRLDRRAVAAVVPPGEPDRLEEQEEPASNDFDEPVEEAR
jgi:preprotein translocase subunit YajC